MFRGLTERKWAYQSQSVCFCHVRVSELIYTLSLPECQRTPRSKQARYMKFR